MKNLLIFFAFATVATMAYFNSGSTCAFAGKPESVASADESAKPSTISMESQPGVPAGWVTDFNGAIQQAKAEKKAVIIDFTGSDWCTGCILLQKEVFTQPEFEKFAKDNLVRVYVDFPKGKLQSPELEQQNQELAQAFRVIGFPTIFVLDSEGTPIAQLGYQPGGAKRYVETLKEVLSQNEKS